MSILDNQNNSQINQAKLASDRLKNMTVQNYNQMVVAFNYGAKLFWDNPAGVSPSDIAQQLGTDAKEVFELHYKLGQLLSDVKPDAISEGLNVIGNFTMNEDGTVTIL